MANKITQEFVKLYAQDVMQNPDTYKDMIRNNPEVYALQLIEHLEESEQKQLLRDFKQELRELMPC